MQACPTRASKDSKFTNSKVRSNVFYDFAEKKTISFSVNANLDNSVDTDKINVLSLQGLGSAFNRAVVILNCGEKGFYIDFVDRTLDDIEKKTQASRIIFV